jgi:hypothetical protein
VETQTTGEQPARVREQARGRGRAARGPRDMAEPAGLPGGWTPVNSSYQRQGDGSVLRVGYVAPGGGLQWSRAIGR